jgi:hypothetical protein
MSTKIQLKLNSSNDLKMSVKAYGDIDTITEVALVVESDLFDYKFTGKVVGDEVHIKIPKLQGIVEAGDYIAKLNLVADGDKFFTPLTADVNFAEIGSVNVSEAKIESGDSDVKVELITDTTIEPEQSTKLKSETAFSSIFDKKDK